MAKLHVETAGIRGYYGAGHLVTTTFVQWQNQVVNATTHHHIVVPANSECNETLEVQNTWVYRSR